MTTAEALVPLGLALLLLLVARRTALEAGAAGLIAALGLVTFSPAFLLSPAEIGAALVRGVLVSLVVAYVLFFGLLLYHLNAAGGGIARIEALLAEMPGGASARAVVLCLPLGAFFEAISGFGTGVVMVAPLLRGLGFRAERAALLSLLTQNAVPWGALGVGVVLSAELANLPLEPMGLLVAALTAPLFAYFAAVGLVLAGGWAALRREWPLWAFLAVATGAALLGACWLVGFELGMVVAGPVVAGAAFVLMSLGAGAAPSMSFRGAPGDEESRLSRVPPAPDETATGEIFRSARNDMAERYADIRALVPYAFLVALLLVTRLVGPIRVWLSTHLVLGPVQLLYSPGFTLLLACLATVAVLRPPVKMALARTSRQWLRATAALVAFVTLSELMLRSGMTERLALSAPGLVGPAYLLVAAWLAGLSGFVTGSNAAGAAMMLPFQLRIAEQVGLPRMLITALQNAAAGAGSLAAPQRVVLAATILGIPREEGRLVRAALLVELGVMAILTLAAFAASAFSLPASP